jgi:hypothetical protein
MKKFKVYARQIVLIAAEVEAENKESVNDLLESADWTEIERETDSVEIQEE